MADIIQQRRDTAARWAQYNPILMEGEVGYVTDNPNQYKIGNGVSRWNDLPLRGYTGTIAQETGDDENAVMSQKVTTEKLSELGSEIEIYKPNFNYLKEIYGVSASKNLAYINLKGKFFNENGELQTSSSNASIIPVENGRTYYGHKPKGSSARLFNNRLEHIELVELNNADYEVTIPNDGIQYYLQTLSTIEGDMWVSVDEKLSEYYPPLFIEDDRFIDVDTNEKGTSIEGVSKTKNIARPTRFNQYLNKDCELVNSDAVTESCLIQLEGGKTYHVHVGEGTAARVFVLNEKLRHVYMSMESYFIYECPQGDGIYYLQVLNTKDSKSWVSADEDLPTYESPYVINAYLETEKLLQIQSALNTNKRSENLGIVTTKGYYNEQGVFIDNYYSSFIPLIGGKTYYVHKTSGVSCRIFNIYGTEVRQYIGYTSITDVEFTCPTDGKIYWMQILALSENDNTFWVSVDKPLDKYISPIIREDRKQLNVLFIGSSFMRDAMSYMSLLWGKYNQHIQLNLGNVFEPSCNFEMHCTNIEGNLAVYDYGLFDSFVGKWEMSNNVTMDTALLDKQWDLVVLIQASVESTDYSTFSPYLSIILEHIKNLMSSPIKLGWVLVPSWANGSSLIGDKTSDEMFEEIAYCAQKVMEDYPFELLFPCGTAIQRARKNEILNAIGDFGQLTYEGIHLQNGIGCLIESYVIYLELLKFIGEKGGIIGDETVVTTDYINSIGMPTPPYGNVVGLSKENNYLGQICAIQAVKNPFTI